MNIVLVALKHYRALNMRLEEKSRAGAKKLSRLQLLAWENGEGGTLFVFSLQITIKYLSISDCLSLNIT